MMLLEIFRKEGTKHGHELLNVSKLNSTGHVYFSSPKSYS